MLHRILMTIMALGVVTGALDWIFGNRKGYGKKMEEGFLLLGPTAVSMAGILCLAPFFAETIGRAAVPFYRWLGIDPGMFGGLLAIDMGGFQIAEQLADDPLTGAYGGIVVSAIFGCTLVFTIPVGMGLIEKEDREVFAKGIMLGLLAMPLAFVAGAAAAGIGVWQGVRKNLPVFFLAVLILLGLRFRTEKMVKGFQKFAAAIRTVTICGLAVGAVAYLLAWEPPFAWMPLPEAMEVVSSIGIVLLGSLPAAELLQRMLRKPLERLGRRFGMNSVSMAGMLVGFVSVVPAITMLKDMDRKGKLVNVAMMVSSASMLAAHLGFTAAEAPQLLGALLVAKCTGALAGMVLAAAAFSMQRAA